MFEKFTGRTPSYMDEGQYKKYAVLAPFLPDTGEFLFQVRSSKLKRQPGEICFPGGHIEGVETPLEAGIRETQEELLVTGEDISVIAPLDVLATPYYAMVYPFLANLSNYSYTYNTDEVSEVFTVPFDFFLQNEPTVYYNQITTLPEDDKFPYALLGVESYPWGKARYAVLFYQYGDKVIWGMTAKIVQHIVALYKDSYGA